ncbi:unnamed protein product [Peronospora destructor]|uniref:Uncharacterized protein n=1 Tax=Peronospora destructor TaxID=86335 RepID=A0AAV0V9P9_9STRA|nr:unnamed protein product [Peronospora destructor]
MLTMRPTDETEFVTEKKVRLESHFNFKLHTRTSSMVFLLSEDEELATPLMNRAATRKIAASLVASRFGEDSLSIELTCSFQSESFSKPSPLSLALKILVLELLLESPWKCRGWSTNKNWPEKP